ncbi:hypothetical protein M3650_19145 [Paenibacillus sp. MER TA 81-3]|uniref:hypothetical protein n=1 Tax=Paenibacillus sp. MER TA 81-3 TaxID=2939573 RepID=UPI0020420F86|nr:hypothetical protein [Paenibacillus sp. MER TA 81-3]MCM3340686.1 hypothetical protein [Paenibacillus sp. MER TA 81-3]
MVKIESSTNFGIEPELNKVTIAAIEFTFSWVSILSVIAAVFVIVGSAMLYSSAKVKKENIIDALKQENI